MSQQLLFKKFIGKSLLLLLLLITLLAIWSSYAPLQSASLANGVIRVEGKRQSLKSVYPGMIKSIHVEEGQTVSAGELLLSIDTREDEIELKQRLSELAQLYIAEARLDAYLNERVEIVYTDKVLALIEKMNLRSLMQSSRQMHAEQIQLLFNNKDMLAIRQDSHEAQISGKQQTLMSLRKQMSMTTRERNSAEKLVSQQYLSENRLIDFDRNLEQLQTQASQVDTESQVAGQSLQEMKINRRQFDSNERFKTLTELYGLQSRRPLLQSQINLLRLRIARASLLSPVGGRVVNRRVNTVGASIDAGQLLLELVPADDRLILDVQLNPKDIEHVHTGSSAKVRFLAYSPRQYPPVAARVESVAADISLDSDGKSYYSVTLVPDAEFEGISKSLQLYPGMPAEATILTGTRTLMDYLLSPLMNIRQKSLRER